MKYLLIFSILFLSLNIKAQDLITNLERLIENTQYLSEIENKDTLEKYLGSKKYKVSLWDSVSYYNQITQKRYKVFYKKKTKNLLLSIVAQKNKINEKIVYTELLDTNFKLYSHPLRDPLNIILKKNNDGFFNDLNDSFIKELGMPLNLNLVERRFLGFRTNLNQFGFMVGIAAYTPNSTQQMLKLVVENNQDSLKELMISFSPVNRICGYIGLKILESEGLVLDNQSKLLFEAINSNYTPVVYREGCTAFLPMSLTELVNSERTKYLISNWRKFLDK